MTQGKAQETTMGGGKNPPSTGASLPATSSSTPQPKAAVSRPGKIPRQCAYFASEGGCQKGEKCLYLHEMEGGKSRANKHTMAIFISSFLSVSRSTLVGGKAGSICHFALPLVLECLGSQGIQMLGKTARKTSLSHPFLYAPNASKD